MRLNLHCLFLSKKKKDTLHLDTKIFPVLVFRLCFLEQLKRPLHENGKVEGPRWTLVLQFGRSTLTWTSRNLFVDGWHSSSFLRRSASLRTNLETIYVRLHVNRVFNAKLGKSGWNIARCLQTAYQSKKDIHYENSLYSFSKTERI